MHLEISVPTEDVLRGLGAGEFSLDDAGIALCGHAGMHRWVEAGPERDLAGVRAPVFTSSSRAGAHTRAAAAVLVTTPWIEGVRELLRRGAAGVVIDEGTPHRLEFDNLGLCQLYAAMTVEWLAGQEGLFVLCDGGSFRVQDSGHGARMLFAYDDEASAERGLRRVRRSSPGASVLGVTFRSVLELVRESGVGMLVVNHRLEDERTYLRRHLQRMALCAA